MEVSKRLNEVRAALRAADLRVLVLSLFHITGDEIWLGERYRPVRDVRLVSDPTSGYSAEIQEEILTAAERLLANGVPKPVISDPGPAMFQRMMSHCLGEPVPPEYVSMMRADFGFMTSSGATAEDAGGHAPTPGSSDKVDVVIVGAGASGICLAAKLVSSGFSVTVLERNGDVGGTWYENRYPGCGVDTPNHFYSYSFRPNARWRYYFSPRDELQAYLGESARELGIYDRIRFHTAVEGAVWDETRQKWSIETRTSDGHKEVVTAGVMVCAVGHFNTPNTPPLAGLTAFLGETLHTARWPHDVSLAGKRVGVVGTGASAMQLVPSIVDQVASLTIFQRTAQWVRPVDSYHQPVDEAATWLFVNLPFYTKWFRFTQFWRFGDGLLRSLHRDPAWETDQAINRRNDGHRQELTAYLETQLEDRPDLLSRCLPDYPAFGKRILIDNGWYDALRMPHVRLVSEQIAGVESAGVRISSSELIELDVLVLATGFKVGDASRCLNVQGREGMTLAEDWAHENPTAFLGMMVPRFPNFFVMFGPNTNMGHGGSGMWLAETQSHYIAACLEEMRAENIVTVEVRADARDRYTEKIDELHRHLIWTHPKITTYYRNRFGQVRSPMPFRLVDYWEMTRRPDMSLFHVTRRTPG